MSASSLIPYKPPERFLRRLSENGFSLKKRDMQPVRNCEAERLLPPAKATSAKGGLFFFFQMILVFCAVHVKAVVAAELVIPLPELDFIHDPMSWVLSLQVLFLCGFFLVCVALLRAIRRVGRDRDMSVSVKGLQVSDGAGCQVVDAKSRGARRAKGATEKIRLLPERGVFGNMRLAMGGASRTGRVRSENQDAFITQYLGRNTGLMVVCDGVGGHPGGAEAARYGAFYVRRFLSRLLASEPVSADVLRTALLLVQRLFALQEIEGLTTVIAAVVDKGWLHYATLGDGALSLIHADGMVQELLAPHHALGEAENVITAYLCASESFEPRVGAVAWEPGSMLLAMSDGASDLLPLDQLAGHRSAYLRHLQRNGVDGLCDYLLRIIEAARDAESGALLHSDNMTLAIAASLVADVEQKEGSADGAY